MKSAIALVSLLAFTALASAASPKYSDGRPAATRRMDAKDHGIVLRHSDGPDQCDVLGARDVWVFEANGTYYMHYEEANQTWFLFTNHIGIDQVEYTDAVWLYWSKDLNRWDPKNKAIVLDGRNCTWSKKCIGLPSVLPFGKRLALFYDAPGGESTSHMKRDIGLAWLELPLVPPE